MNQPPRPIAIISAHENAPADTIIIREVAPAQWIIQDLGLLIQLTPAGSLLAQVPTDQSIGAPPPTGLVEAKTHRFIDRDGHWVILQTHGGRLIVSRQPAS